MMTTETLSPLMARRWTRWVLLLLILLAFARLVWRLDAKNLWLDESFSLQRAESSWIDIFHGIIPISDGVHTVQTVDQHPFAFFALLGLTVRLLGKSEFALRLPAVAAATLLVPVCWAFARRLARRGALPPAAPDVRCAACSGQPLLSLVRAGSPHVRPGCVSGHPEHLPPGALD